MLDTVKNLLKDLADRRQSIATDYAGLVQQLFRGGKTPAAEDVARILDAAGKSEDDLLHDVELEGRRAEWRAQRAKRSAAHSAIDHLSTELRDRTEAFRKKIADMHRKEHEETQAIQAEIRQHEATLSKAEDAHRNLLENPSPIDKARLQAARDRCAAAFARLRAAENRLTDFKVSRNLGTVSTDRARAEIEADIARLKAEHARENDEMGRVEEECCGA